MPSLFRFLTVVGIIAGVGYGLVFALANFVNPKPREMTVTIPPDRFLVGESGIRNGDDVRRMAAMGCDAILVGETFCKLPQAARGAAVRKFVQEANV